MKSTRYITVLVGWCSIAWSQTVCAEVDFDSDIRPILARACFHCHGPDAEARMGDLRLDANEHATAENDGRRALVPGQPNQSELYLRITAADPSDRMPPADSNLSLSREEIGRIKTWIEQGAPWSQHWSLRPLNPPPVPDLPEPVRDQVRNDIDHFVRARLADVGFAPAPAADKRTLIRRVTFDLTGLPPNPSEITAFLADTSNEAFERVVDGLLASPRYGERQARHWMDAVHYADTHGHDEDAIREHAWPYRDYLIASFNSDKPYARFVQEQIAGDVLFPDDARGVVAIGMLAAGPWDESSQMGIQDGTTDKEIARYLDRDDMIATVMNTFVSMTVQCARCHHHKFDPIPTEDYYGLQAVFAGVDRVNRPYDRDSAVAQRRSALLREKVRLDSATFPQRELLSDDALARVDAWERSRSADAWRIVPITAVVSSGGATATQLDDGSILFSGERPETDVYTITSHSTAGRITAVRLEVMADDSLFHNGPGRQENGNLHLSEFKLLASNADGLPRQVPLHRPVADFDQSDWTIAHAIDGNPATAWGIYPQTGRTHQAVFELVEPIDAAAGVTLTFELKQLHGGRHLIGRPRLSTTAASSPGTLFALAAIPPEIADVLAIPGHLRSDDQRAQLSRFVLQRNHAAAIAALPEQALVYSVAGDFTRQGNFVPAGMPRPVHVLHRGNVLNPIAPAVSGALSCIDGLEPKFTNIDTGDEGQRRAALARWISDRENVLTWRSIVNRVWHHHFGRGLVETVNDFGRNGSAPSHPGLLDWLAAWFRDSGGSLKQLHRLIVTSATYRQSSQHNELFAATDHDNRDLYRMNRRRLDAESVRDAILQMAGRMDWTSGGPSARQFVTGSGVHLTPTVDYENFDVESSDARRRSVYRFVFRTVPDPFMEALDCPDASQLTPARSESLTSLQALAMLNNRFVVTYCEHMGRRLEQETADRRLQIRRLFELAFGRPPTELELGSVAGYADHHGMANACRVILNSNEFLFVN